jgi:hypothetical protein
VLYSQCCGSIGLHVISTIPKGECALIRGSARDVGRELFVDSVSISLQRITRDRCALAVSESACYSELLPWPPHAEQGHMSATHALLGLRIQLPHPAAVHLVTHPGHMRNSSPQPSCTERLSSSLVHCLQGPAAHLKRRPHCCAVASPSLCAKEGL